MIFISINFNFIAFFLLLPIEVFLVDDYIFDGIEFYCSNSTPFQVANGFWIDEHWIFVCRWQIKWLHCDTYTALSCIMNETETENHAHIWQIHGLHAAYYSSFYSWMSEIHLLIKEEQIIKIMNGNCLMENKLIS